MSYRTVSLFLLIVLLSLSAIAQDAALTTKQTNIHAAAALKSKILLTVKKNTTLKTFAYEFVGDWYPVVHGKILGWVNKDNIEFDDLLAEASRITRTRPKNRTNKPAFSISAMNKADADKKKQEEIDDVIKWARNLSDVTDKTKDEWFSIWRNENKEYFLNPSKVVRNGNRAEFWLKLKVLDMRGYWADKGTLSGYNSLADLTQNFDFALEMLTADCKYKTLGTHKQINYDKEGNPTTIEFSGTLRPVVPETQGEVLWTNACGVK